jgi:hypothetical protein
MKHTLSTLILVTGLAISALGQSGSPSECVPAMKDCQKPVKWIADKNDCSCYACEYGKANQHTGCTKDPQLRAELIKLQEGDDQEVARVMTIKGTIKSNGDTYTFVSDKDDKDWQITNPEALKGHEGHHVQVNAQVYAEKNQIHVMGIKILKGDKPDGSKD